MHLALTSFIYYHSIQKSLLQENFSIEVLSQDSLAGKLNHIYKTIRNAIVNALKTHPKNVIRIFLPTFHTIISDLWMGYNVENLEEDIHKVVSFLLQLKRLLRLSGRATVILGMDEAVLATDIYHAMEVFIDSIFNIDSFATRMHAVPYEFREFLGFFAVKKLQQVGMLASPVLKGTRFGIKRDRRKLHIEPLHLPPEESRAFASNCSAPKPVSQSTSVPSAVASVSMEASQTSKLTTNTAQKNVDQVGREMTKILINEDNKDKESKSGSSLAASLAAVRVARAAQKATDSATVNLPTPISISVNKSKSISLDKNSIDF
jgi:hypothetical protein